jgi:hypothetical protein
MGAITLTAAVTAKSKHSPINPAFHPKKWIPTRQHQDRSNRFSAPTPAPRYLLP